MKKIIITIDGESSSGKTTLSKELAKNISYKHINTGSMYRAVALIALQKGMILDSQSKKNNFEFNADVIIKMTNQLDFDFKLVNGVSNIFLNGLNIENKIRSIKVSDYVSQISTIPELRRKIVNIQRKLGFKKGIVMEGRDIGTIVFPKAELKFFITADFKVRVDRRFNELKKAGVKIKKSYVFENLKKRDFLDKNRKASPLIQAKDAMLIDNTNLTVDDQILIINNYIKKII